MTEWKCSRCPQTFDDKESTFEISKDTHALGMHSRNRVIYSERDGSPSKPMGNHDYGPVEWIKQ